MSLAVRGVFWTGIYIAVVAGPLVFALVDAPAGRGFWIEFSVALGFIGLSLMGMQFALVARFRSVAAPFGEDAVIQFHRQMAYVATIFVVAHPVILFVADIELLALLNVFEAPWRARFPWSRCFCWSRSWSPRSGEAGSGSAMRPGSFCTACSRP